MMMYLSRAKEISEKLLADAAMLHRSILEVTEVHSFLRDHNFS